MSYKISTGVELSTLFEKYVSGTQATATGYLDLSGNDFSTIFAPYVSGTQTTETGYKIASGMDLNTVFAPFVPNFPTIQSITSSNNNWIVDMKDGTNCVMSSHNLLSTPTFLFWSNDCGATLNKATIDGSVINFSGYVAISGANAIAMGNTSSNSTRTFYLSNDYGHSYTVTPTSGQSVPGYYGGSLAMNGSNAVCGGAAYNTFYSTNYGANWSVSTGSGVVAQIAMYENITYCGTNGTAMTYSTNGGQTFTASSNIFGFCVTKCGTNLYIGGSYKIYKSTDNGVSGTVVYTSVRNVLCIASCPGTNGDFIWAGNEDNNINCYSNDGGTTWTQCIGIHGTRTCVVTPTRIIAGGGGVVGFFRGKNAYII